MIEILQSPQSDSSKRCLELLGSGLTYEEMKPLIFRVLETMRDDDVLRTDRPMPTDPKAQWQVPLVKGMNESDADYIERIDEYKNEHEVKLVDRIPLTDLQEEWLRYVNCESDIKPLPIETKKQGIALVKPNGEIEDLDSIPF
jgi:hypothetical protein